MSCVSILNYRPKVTFFDLDSFLNNPYISSKIDELSSIYITYQDFNRFKLQPKESAAVFFFDKNENSPSYFTTVNLYPLTEAFHDADNVFAFKCIPVSIILIMGILNSHSAPSMKWNSPFLGLL